jgi:DNA modification methylase
MKVARNLKRNSVIYEVNAKYMELIKNNVGWNNATEINSGVKYEIKVRKPVTN